MLVRALIVLLVILNLGVAAWWAFSPEPTSSTAASVPLHAPGLQLATERMPVKSAGSIQASIGPAIHGAPAVNAPVAVDAGGGAQCMTVGPFADASALETARAALQPRVSRLLVRLATSDRKGWRVWLPPLPDHDSALAMATRIDAAGFKDYYVLPSGDEANGIALGRYGSEQAARRQQSALQAAGFPAQAEALGATTQWLDLVTTASNIDAIRSAAGASQLRILDCTKLGP